MSADEIAACREVVSRKAGGFWVEGSPRTTVRNVLHDCVHSGPPVSSQPHNLKGEAAAWVDEKLEDEVKRGQLVRGISAWGGPPFPTKEAPSHKRHRKRRLVVDCWRVNARVQRSTYYCRLASVLAAAAGSVWYSMVDAVSGFNQIRNSKRAMEILAIVARSGKFLPVCLTFGPVNGPGDFSYVVDRAYAPRLNRKMRFGRQRVAYVDDLTIRTGRVIGNRHLTDEEVEQEIKNACREAGVVPPQAAATALQNLGVPVQGSSGKKQKASLWNLRHAKDLIAGLNPTSGASPDSNSFLRWTSSFSGAAPGHTSRACFPMLPSDPFQTKGCHRDLPGLLRRPRLHRSLRSRRLLAAGSTCCHHPLPLLPLMASAIGTAKDSSNQS